MTTQRGLRLLLTVAPPLAAAAAAYCILRWMSPSSNGYAKEISHPSSAAPNVDRARLSEAKPLQSAESNPGEEQRPVSAPFHVARAPAAEDFSNDLADLDAQGIAADPIASAVDALLACADARPDPAIPARELVLRLIEAPQLEACAQMGLLSLLSPDLLDGLTSSELASLSAQFDPDFEQLLGLYAARDESEAGKFALRVFQVYRPSSAGATQLLRGILRAFPGEEGLRIALEYAGQYTSLKVAMESIGGEVDAFSAPILAEHAGRAPTLSGVLAATSLMNHAYGSTNSEEDRAVIQAEADFLVGRTSAQFWQEGSRLEDSDHMGWRRYREALLLQSRLQPAEASLESIDQLLSLEEPAIRGQATWVLSAIARSRDASQQAGALERLRASCFDSEPYVCFEALEQLELVDPQWRDTAIAVAAEHPLLVVRRRAKRTLEQ